MDRVINYAFLLLLIFLFVLDSTVDERIRIGIAIIGALSFSYFVFLFNWISLDGASAASVLGIVILGLGGWDITILLLLFFVSSTFVSGRSIVKIEETAQAFAERSRRNGIQVWSNGFWIAFFVILSSIFDSNLYLVGAAGAVAAATADTWATELGSSRFNTNTYLITSFEKIPAHTDGGVSLPGSLAGLAGSLLIAVAAALLFPLPIGTGIIILFLAGFSGCVADSYFGATFQQDNVPLNIGPGPSAMQITLDNNFVNWAATGVGSLAAIILNLILL